MERGTELADIIVGVMMVPLGLLGLLLASRAMDGEMYLFGMGLAAFASVFGFGLLKAHFDQADAARSRVVVSQEQKVLVPHG